jgi:hypothetical protein
MARMRAEPMGKFLLQNNKALHVRNNARNNYKSFFLAHLGQLGYS